MALAMRARACAREKSLKNFRQVPRLIAITAKGQAQQRAPGLLLTAQLVWLH
jgi:hypothetical protein